MRIDVSAPAWDAVALALSAGNQGAAGSHARLAAAVAGGAGMAGDDATSTDFAAAYDAAAQAALDALADLVDGYATLSRLTRASLDHHRRADQASTIGCADREVLVLDPGVSLGAAQLVTVTRRSVPSARGGEPADLPAHVRWVLDQIQGFCWPNAEVTRLRRVARAWATAAGEVEELTRHCATATTALGDLSGPEMPVARVAVGNLDAARSGLVVQLGSIGHGCSTYADDVQRHRQQILDLVVELIAGAVVVEGIGLVLGVVTAGLTAAGATAINATRIAAAAPKVLAIVEAQSTLARIGATGLALARSSLLTGSTLLSRLAGARVLTYAAHAADRGAKVGMINPAPLPPLPASLPITVDLCDHEGVAGAHTVREHVGRTDEQMRQRLRSTGKSDTSSFPDLHTAEKAVNTLLGSSASRIGAWLGGSQPKLRLNGDAGFDVGRTVSAIGRVRVTSGVRVILRRSASMPTGYVVLTSFPDPLNEAP